MERRPDGTLDPRKVVGYIFVAGMVLAPFLALTFSVNIGLTVMTFALAATTYLAIDAINQAEPVMRPRLRLLAGVNAFFCLVCLVILIARIV